MINEAISEKYAAIEKAYGLEGAQFARKIINIYAQGRGVDGLIWKEVLRLYGSGDIVVYGEDVEQSELRDKILLRHAVIEKGDHAVNAAFGFVGQNGSPVFAEQDHSLLYDWDGQVNSLTTSILDVGKAFHGRLIDNRTKLWAANNQHAMVRALQITNRLSDHIRRN